MKLFKGRVNRVRIIHFSDIIPVHFCHPHIQLVTAGLMLQQLTYFLKINDLTTGGKLTLVREKVTFSQLPCAELKASIFH